MDLHNGRLYWPTTLENNALNNSQKSSKEKYDVIIIGGGMSGSLCAYALVNEGLKIAIVDKGKIASGSSSANTGLLQYSSDIMLYELIDKIGKQKAVRFYELCKEAIEQLEEVASSLPIERDFIRRKSVCFASNEEHVEKLKKEYETLREHGFPCEYWTKEELKKHFPFSKPAALVTYGDAEVNPYRFVQGIVQYLVDKGVDIFENAKATEITENEDGVKIQTSTGDFFSNHVVYATGYETLSISDKIGADINRSYAIATEPIEDLSSWEEKAMIWETKRPYLYMRTTVDNRIIAGGLDEDVPEAPQNEKWIKNRADRIVDSVNELFPSINAKVAYSWGASFGESLDSLPFIGKHPAKERQFYLLGYGGNGTVYSMMGANILKDLIQNRDNPDAEIVKLDR